MKKTVAWLLIIALLLCCLPAALAEGETADWMMFASRTEPYYSDAAKAYTLPLYEGESIDSALSLPLKTGEEAEVSFSVPQDGLYELWFSYCTETQSALPSEMTLTVDGSIPFYELRRVKLKSLWKDDGVFPLDRYGNEIATTPTAQRVPLTCAVQDSAGWTDSPFLFELTAGEHTLLLQMQEGAVTLEGLSVRAKAALPVYEGRAAEGNALIVIEGERIDSRNKSSIRAAGEFDPNLTPYETRHRKMNFLDGASFDAAGDEVTWRFTAEEEGWYYLGFRYRQSVKADFPVFADVLIDRELSSAEARQIAFDYATSFAFGQALTGDGNAQTFYLSAGEHTLTLRLNGAALLPVYEVINKVLSEINGLSLEVVRLTGGVTTDRYRDYELLTYIPDLVEILNGWAKELDETVERMKVYSAVGSGSAFSSLTLAADQLRRLALKPEDLPRRLSELSTGSNSASRMLAQQLQDIAQNDLSIDEILFYQADAKLPEGSPFLSTVAKNAERFLTSFGSQDYAAGTGKKGHLQVWMGRSRQYLEIVQNMVDAMFTPETGIEVDLSIMPDANKLVLANAAGTAPDVVLSLQYVVPSYLNIRGALYDLTQFDDFPEIAQRFSSGLFIPYTLGDGIYAMPETVNFWVQFYRKDILNALNIDVPDNMEQVKMILPELQRRNMNYYFPTAGMSGMKVFPGTLPLILQSGGSIYGETIGDTTLDSEESLRGFREMTELFTVYNMPTDVPSPGFYQQFRDGTLPIGIADLGTYNLLLNAAPELDGMWDISLFPGLMDEEGNVLRWTTGGAETMAILSQTEMPNEAWTFLKWWSSAEVQSSFGNLLQSTYGSEYIWPTANREAFETLPLKAAHKKTILEQMEWMTEAPWVLGTYMLERELSNAFISVAVDGTDARRALDTAVKRINRETYRKLEEFGYWKDGVMLREFRTPDVTVVQGLIDRYNQRKEAEE
ncbi:MAG: extracellular solute-binding protein [Clostridia bacterium]|nr:extracellular solute-binding protein [Clostridia bacterium]